MLTGGTPSPRRKARDKEDLSFDCLDRKKAFAASKGRHGVNDASNTEAEVLVEDDSDDDDANGGRPCRETRAAKGGRSANNPADRADDGRRPTKAPSKSGRGVPTHPAIGRRGVPVYAVGGRGVPAGTPRKNVRGGKPSFLFRLDRERAYAAANRAHGAGAETANDDNSTTTATAMGTTAETRMKAVGGKRQNPQGGRWPIRKGGAWRRGRNRQQRRFIRQRRHCERPAPRPPTSSPVQERGAQVGGRQDPTQEGMRRGGVTHLPPRPRESARSRRRRDQRHGQGRLG